jgi:hypothetical protein
MDAIDEKPLRNSRWSRDPIVGRDGVAAAVRLTGRDIAILKLLARFRYLPADYIHAFIDGNEKALSHRLNLLSRRPNVYIARPHQQRQNADANCRPLIYELDERACRLLREHGFSLFPKRHHRNFAHELMVSQITASIELGVRDDSNVRLITWAEILASDKTPRTTREAASPASISVSYALRSDRRTETITADASPFGLERMIEGKRSYLFFPGIEADCGTEPVDAGDPGRSSIAKKFAAYAAIAEQGIYRSHFGFPNFFVPFITTSSARLASMMQLLNRQTGGRGSKIFLFKTFPSFTSPEPPAPSGHMLTEPWQRVGFPSLSLDR